MRASAIKALTGLNSNEWVLPSPTDFDREPGRVGCRMSGVVDYAVAPSLVVLGLLHGPTNLSNRDTDAGTHIGRWRVQSGWLPTGERTALPGR